MGWAKVMTFIPVLRIITHPKSSSVSSLSLSLPLGLSSNVTPSWFLNGQEEPEVRRGERGSRAGDVMKSGSKEEGIRAAEGGKIEQESEGPDELCGRIRFLTADVKVTAFVNSIKVIFQLINKT